jgi:hypothetical protein
MTFSELPYQDTGHSSEHLVAIRVKKEVGDSGKKNQTTPLINKGASLTVKICSRRSFGVVFELFKA